MSLSFWPFLILSAIFSCCRPINCSRSSLPGLNYPVYWNIPTFQCKSHRIFFGKLAKELGIVQNDADNFKGNRITILYDPGAFPAILNREESGETVLRNGGIPQRGNLTFHLEIFKEAVHEQISNSDFDGVAVIDFESWRPIYRQNFAALLPYKELSKENERQAHPFWPKFLIEKEAQKNFEYSAKVFMEETIIYARLLRPRATWGYYGYPMCFNMAPKNKETECSGQVSKENDQLDWLFLQTDNLHPSLYLSEHTLTSKEKLQLIKGRIDESHRIVGYITNHVNTIKILPYFWLKYRNTAEFLSKEDLSSSLKLLSKLHVDGLVLWGSSKDVNTKSKCEQLYKYVDNTLRMALKTRLD